MTNDIHSWLTVAFLAAGASAATSCANRMKVDVSCSAMSMECATHAGPFHWDEALRLYRMQGPNGCLCGAGFVPRGQDRFRRISPEESP